MFRIKKANTVMAERMRQEFQNPCDIAPHIDVSLK
jgi:hypothetical protein